MFWPIHKHEVTQVLVMSALLFCMLFEYTVARILKDSFILTNSPYAKDALSILKVFVIFAALGFAALYAKLVHTFSKKQVFYMITGVFGAFFFIFGNVLYPYSHVLHMSPERALMLCDAYPRLRGFITLASLWSYVWFYIMAEIWGTVGITVLFWQFANEVTSSADSKRFYISFQSLGNYALIIASLTVMNVLSGHGAQALPVSSVKLAANLVSGFIALSVVIYTILINNILDMSKVRAPKVKKAKLSMKESLKKILESKHLAYIALLLICYGASINIIEISWKGLLQAYAKESGIAVHVLQARAFLYTGITAVFISTIGKGTVDVIGWKTTALITPIGMLASGLIFFATILSPNLLLSTATKMHLSILGFGTFVGTAQNVFAKSAKYVLFDTTKEMAYIPLSDELKTEGKAAVEVVGGRAGKGLGGLIQATLTMLTGLSATALTPYFALILIAIVLVWITIVGLLAYEHGDSLNKKIES